MKTCTKCKELKPVSAFHKQKTGRDGVRASCKQCQYTYERAKFSGENSELHKRKQAAAVKKYRDSNPEAVRASKRKYYASEKGKASKLKEDLAYTLSGKRALCEKRRAEKGISDARKLTRRKYAIVKRSADNNLNDFDTFVLSECLDLVATRNKLTGIKWHIDHIHPISKGGNSNAYNLQVVPAKWNRWKSNKHECRFFNTNRQEVTYG